MYYALIFIPKNYLVEGYMLPPGYVEMRNRTKLRKRKFVTASMCLPIWLHLVCGTEPVLLHHFPSFLSKVDVRPVRVANNVGLLDIVIARLPRRFSPEHGSCGSEDVVEHLLLHVACPKANFSRDGGC